MNNVVVGKLGCGMSWYSMEVAIKSLSGDNVIIVDPKSEWDKPKEEKEDCGC